MGEFCRQSICFVAAVGATLHLGALPTRWAYLLSFFNKASCSFKDSFGMIKKSCTRLEDQRGKSSSCIQSFWLHLPATLRRLKLRQTLTFYFSFAFRTLKTNFISNTGGKQSYQLASYIWILLRSVCREDLCAIV